MQKPTKLPERTLIPLKAEQEKVKLLMEYLCLYMTTMSTLAVSSFASSNLCPDAIPTSSHDVSCTSEPRGKTCLICPTSNSNNLWWYRNSKTIFDNGVFVGVGPIQRKSCHSSLESLEVSGFESGSAKDVYECASGSGENIIRKFILNFEVKTSLVIRKLPITSGDNNTFNGSVPELNLECVLLGAYGNVSLAWYVNDQLKLRETFYDVSRKTDENMTYTLILNHPNTSKIENVSCRSNGLFINDSNVTLTFNKGVCSSRQCEKDPYVNFWSSFTIIILIVAAGSFVSIGSFLCVFKRKRSGHVGRLKLNPRKSMKWIRESYRAASIFTPSYTETNSNNQGIESQMNVKTVEVSQEVQIKTRGDYEYWKGYLTTQSQNKRPCFIKTLAAKSTLENAFVFKQYAEELSKLQVHENITEVLSISTKSVPYSIYFENVECGSLRDFIISRYQDVAIPEVDQHSLIVKATVVKRQTEELLSFTQDIAKGMSFLESQKFCHPALCLRKVLLTAQVRCKLYDMYPLKMAMPRIKELMKKKHPPTPWLAPETIFIKEYTTASDAWNFAVVLWEIFSLGNLPYAGMTKTLVERQIRQSNILSRPDRCPGSVFSLMLSCWKTSKAERPSFQVIQRQCEDALKNITTEYQSADEDGSSDDYTALDEEEDASN